MKDFFGKILSEQTFLSSKVNVPVHLLLKESPPGRVYIGDKRGQEVKYDFNISLDFLFSFGLSCCCFGRKEGSSDG